MVLEDEQTSQPSNIKIFGRVRPLRANSKFKATPGRYWINQPTTTDETRPLIGFHVPREESYGLINNQRESFEFQFDRLFDVDASQEEVFDNVAKPVIQSCLKGFNGTIFAYGQTGSGKTFTITGGAEKYADRGLIPRTLQYIYRESQKNPDLNISVQVSYLEIYNESGYDLLDTTRDAKKLEDLPKVTLMEDSDEMIHLKNLRMVPAASEEEALNLLFVGDTNRMIAETPSNPSSSRSHCIFIISLTVRQEGEDVIRKSKLHLVDLAGSERVARTRIDGTLLKEAKHINLSLHYLEQVIIALHEQSLGKRSHIPYRNSMMTSVLRDSLGGNCMTTMIATIAIEDMLIDESISTCRFAQRVALISNKARLNQEMDPSLIIERLRQEIARLKAELAILRGESEESLNEPLPDYEVQRVKAAVDAYIAESSNTAELVLSEFRKIQQAYRIFKSYVQSGKSSSSLPSIDMQAIETRQTTKAALNIDSEGMNSKQIQQIDNLKQLISHRDNEINILVSMIAHLKAQLASAKDIVPQSSRPLELSQRVSKVDSIASQEIPPNKTTSSIATLKANLKQSIPRLTTEKAKAFEIFKQGYPSGEWIDKQKSILKEKYAEAKSLGEAANVLRNDIKIMKEQLTTDGDHDRDAIRLVLAEKVGNYKTSYQQLKDMKMEIEHLQHLLEQARVRLTRDFEHWYLNVYMAIPDANIPSNINTEEGRPILLTPSQSELNLMAMTAPVQGAKAKASTLQNISSYSNQLQQPYEPTQQTVTNQLHSTHSRETIHTLNNEAPDRERRSFNGPQLKIQQEAWEPQTQHRSHPLRSRSATPTPPKDLLSSKSSTFSSIGSKRHYAILRSLSTVPDPEPRILQRPTSSLDISSDIDAFYKARNNILAKASESVRSTMSTPVKDRGQRM